MQTFDLLIIGTGGAGVASAIQAVGMGGSVAIVESGPLGGTCVNIGCIPSKNLIEAAEHLHRTRTGFQGIAPCDPLVDWRSVVRQKDALVGELRQTKYVDVLASYPGVTLLRGRAQLLGDGRVRIDGAYPGAGNDNGTGADKVSGEENDGEYRARKLIVATGTTPGAPPIPGLDRVAALDSTTVMELESLPQSIVVLGGSAAGLEFGQLLARFGVKITIVELMDRLLPQEDEEISAALTEYLQAEGIDVYTGASTTCIEGGDTEVVVHLTQGTLSGTLRAEKLLVATGRRPNTSGMRLHEAGVTLTDKGFVQVDATMRTSNPDVYAAGDVTGGPGYVYVAAAGGRISAENAMRSLRPPGNSRDAAAELDLSAVPNVTFTSPQVASVGLTEAKAKVAGYNTQATVLPMSQVPRAIVSRDRRGLVKIVAEASSGKLLGVHAISPMAGEMMGEATLAVRFGLTARDITGTLHAYLTWGESLKLAAQGFTMDVSKLSCCA